MTKNELKKFISKLFNLHKDIKIPFMEWYKNTNLLNPPSPQPKKPKSPKKKRKYTKRKPKTVETVETEEITFPSEIKTELKIITDKGVIKDTPENADIKIKITSEIEKNN